MKSWAGALCPSHGYELILEDAEDERQGEEQEHARTALSLRDFHGHDAPGVQLSNVATCLALRMLWPFSLLVVMVLLKMKWMKPLYEGHGNTLTLTYHQAVDVFRQHSANRRVALPFFLALSVGLYWLSPSYRNTGPPVAVFFPWALCFVNIPYYIAEAASASDMPSKAKRANLVHFLKIVARQCRIPEETILQMKCDGTKASCQEAAELLDPEALVVQRGCWLEDRQLASLWVPSHLEWAFPLDLMSERWGLVARAEWLRDWPVADRYVRQERRINNLAHVTLYVPPPPAGKEIPTILLSCYQRNVPGKIGAVDFTSQMSIGFPIPIPCWVKIMRKNATGGLCLVVVCLTICMACVIPEWHNRGTIWHWLMFLLFAIFGITEGPGMLAFRMIHGTEQLLRRLHDLKVLNFMMAGEAAAAKMCVPLMRLEVPTDLLVWAEVRELCLARYSAKQLEMEVSAVVATLVALGMSACSLYFALQTVWEPGLLSLLTLEVMTLYLIVAIPFFVMGIMVNTESSKSLDLMSQHTLQGHLALSQPGIASADEHMQIQETVTRASLLVQRLREDTSADVHILGIKLTLSTASAIASAIASALAFTLNSLPTEEIRKKLYDSDAWEHITAVANATSSQVTSVLNATHLPMTSSA